MNDMFEGSWCRIILAAVLALSPISSWADFLPPPPGPLRDLHFVENNEFTRPHIPPMITSNDRRIAMGHKDRTLKLLRPEMFRDQSFHNSEAGIGIQASETGYSIGNLFNWGALGGRTHWALCDPGEVNGQTNPYTCGEGKDCYNLSLIIPGSRRCMIEGDDRGTVECKGQGYELNPNALESINSQRNGYFTSSTTGKTLLNQGQMTLWRVDLQVEVSNAKTPEAEITSITASDPVAGPSMSMNYNNMFEPIVTGDGKLLVGRVGGSRVEWMDSHSNLRITVPDNIYMVADNPDHYEACDVNQWSHFLPLAHAPFDHTINTTYGFAMHPFRDPTGKEIPEDFEKLGTYPWIAKDASNISFTVNDNTRSFSVISGEFVDPDKRCVLANGTMGDAYDTSCPTFGEGSAWRDGWEITGKGQMSGNHPQPIGRTLVGLWTLGKMVLVDGDINPADFSLRASDKSHVFSKLYQNTFVRVGATRDNNPGNMPAGNTGNTNFLDSVENGFNYFKGAAPAKVGDAVWTFNTGSGVSSDFNFDDYTNVNSFIVSPMNQAFEYSIWCNGVREDIALVMDGAHWSRRALGRLPQNCRQGVEGRKAVQNAATSLDWAIPKYGEVHGESRIEPVALGGVEGKGVWFNGNTRITYQLPKQSTKNYTYANWYLGVNVRKTNNNTSRLIDFPSGASISLEKDRVILNFGNRGFTRAITLPESIGTQWVHLGFEMSQFGRRVKTFVDGNLIAIENHDKDMMWFDSGDLVLANGLRGWVDNFKVFAQDVNIEFACNQAGGTLVEVGSLASAALRRQANLYNPHDSVYAELSSDMGSSASRIMCYGNRSDQGVMGDFYLHELPRGLTSLREAAIFPEGPLFHDAPRPDSMDNAFCLSCHTADSRGGLSIGALVFNANRLAKDDHRRQPGQPDPVVYGYIPENWLGHGLPQYATDNYDGLNVDTLLLPRKVESGESIEPWLFMLLGR